MKVYSIQIHSSYSVNDCVVATSMADAEKAYGKVFPECKIRAITELYDSVIIAEPVREESWA